MATNIGGMGREWRYRGCCHGYWGICYSVYEARQLLIAIRDPCPFPGSKFAV